MYFDISLLICFLQLLAQSLSPNNSQGEEEKKLITLSSVSWGFCDLSHCLGGVDICLFSISNLASSSSTFTFAFVWIFFASQGKYFKSEWCMLCFDCSLSHAVFILNCVSGCKYLPWIAIRVHYTRYLVLREKFRNWMEWLYSVRKNPF